MIQLAGIIAFVRGGRWLVFCRLVAACAGAILVAVSSTPLPAWFYGIAGAITLAWVAVEGLVNTRHLRLRLRCAMLAVWWLGIALELPYHVMPTIPRLPGAHVFLIGDSLSAGINGEKETWPKLLSGSHEVVLTDLSRSGADTADAMRQAERVSVSGPAALVLVEIGGNDVLRTYRPEAFERALDVLLAKLRDGGRTVVMLELPLPPFHNRYGHAQRRIAKRYGVLLVPKRVLMGILTSEGATVDSIHLSRRGHELMAETMWGVSTDSILWLSCPLCNRFKSDRTSARDPDSGIETAQFNPRAQRWSEYFCRSTDGIRLVGLTPTGRATVAALHLANDPDALIVRAYWVLAGWHPPSDL